MAKAKNSNIFRLWDAQSKDKYGFIPIQDQILPEADLPSAKNPKILDDHASMHWYLQLHESPNTSPLTIKCYQLGEALKQLLGQAMNLSY